MKPCKCGCKVLITEKDNWGRNHDYVLGHGNKGTYHYWNLKGDKHYNWKGGESLNSQGYIMVKCEGHPRAKKNYRYRVRKHILVMEKHIGRFLLKGERVHHINGDKTDNRLENLQLMTDKEHTSYHSKLYWETGACTVEKNCNTKRDPVTGRFLTNQI